MLSRRPGRGKNGVTQAYDFSLAWITQQQCDAGEDGPSMFAALEQLGLHIERQKGETDVLVIDRAQPKPTLN